MAVVKVSTYFCYHLFGLWKQEIESLFSEQPFLVYVDEDDTYVYLPLSPQIIPPVVNASLTPVLCSVDMSTTSMRQFVGNECDLGEYAIEDVTLGDLIPKRDPAHLVRIDNEYLRYLCNFVIRAAGSTTLRAFIKHRCSQHGYLDEYHNVFPSDLALVDVKHTVIELTSEMMRCNRKVYASDKYNRSVAALRDTLSQKLSKNEIEYALCGIVYHMLCDSVVTCMGRLWCFIEGVWVECPSDGYLWNFLTNELVEYLTSEDAHPIASHVKSVHTRTKMLKDIKLRLLDDSFDRLLDSKRELVRMRNGVLNTDTCLLQEAVPSDYVSIVTGVKYEIFDHRSSEMTRLIRILRSIFADEDVLDFFIMSCATFLEGFNVNKVLYIWWGTGNNAKSLVQTLVMKTFGEYCSTAPTSLITGRRTSSSNATPELCHVEKTLVVFLQEPNPDERLKAGMVKEMTGNDRMYTRQLFKSGKTMMFKAKMVIVCNNIIEIPGMDAALRRRIIVLPFLSTFLDPREYNIRSAKGTLDPDCRMIDPNIERQLLECSSAFMYLLCKRYHERQQFHVPQIILDTTEDFITRNNYQLQFIQRFVCVVPGCNTAITEIYEMFKDWFKRSYPGKRIPDLELFATELANEGYRHDDSEVIANVFISYNGDLTKNDTFDRYDQRL